MNSIDYFIAACAWKGIRHATQGLYELLVRNPVLALPAPSPAFALFEHVRHVQLPAHQVFDFSALLGTYVAQEGFVASVNTSLKGLDRVVQRQARERWGRYLKTSVERYSPHAAAAYMRRCLDERVRTHFDKVMIHVHYNYVNLYFESESDPMPRLIALFGAEAKLLDMPRVLWYHSSGRVYEQTGKLTYTLFSCAYDAHEQDALFQAELLARNRQRRLHLLLT